jgi:hypothetical protein
MRTTPVSTFHISIHLAVCYCPLCHSQDLVAQAATNSAQVRQLTQVHAQTELSLTRLLTHVAERYANWKLFLVQERTLSVALNCMRVHGPTMIAEFWAPTADIPRIQVTKGVAAAAELDTE